MQVIGQLVQLAMQVTGFRVLLMQVEIGPPVQEIGGRLLPGT